MTSERSTVFDVMPERTAGRVEIRSRFESCGCPCQSSSYVHRKVYHSVIREVGPALGRAKMLNEDIWLDFVATGIAATSMSKRTQVALVAEVDPKTREPKKLAGWYVVDPNTIEFKDSTALAETSESLAYEPNKWYEVDSSNLEAVFYDQKEEKLKVKFRKDGSVYEFSGVPDEIFFNFMVAPSRGKFFIKFIRGAFEYKRVA